MIASARTGASPFWKFHAARPSTSRHGDTSVSGCPGHSTIHSEFSANRTLSARSSLPSCVLMAIRIPNTMTGLVAAACVLAALPLMIALLLAEVALERVTKQTELLIDDGVAVSQLSNEMRDALQDPEREIGTASGRERGGQNGYVSGGAVKFKKQK